MLSDYKSRNKGVNICIHEPDDADGFFRKELKNTCCYHTSCHNKLTIVLHTVVASYLV